MHENQDVNIVSKQKIFSDLISRLFLDIVSYKAEGTLR
jgi:hypothetical protein